jgi:hypothetical protein
VRRDEEAAQAREEAEEERQQVIDAERRLAILRGEVPPPLPPSEQQTSSSRDQEQGGDGRQVETSQGWGKERRKRKRPNEDDTDFELRIARERNSASAGDNRKTDERSDSTQALVHKPKSSNAPLTDASGHIDLFPVSSSSALTQKNPEAEAEAARKKREYEDQYTLRFSNAAGFKQSLAGPWYAGGAGAGTGDSKEIAERDTPGKDVWGNADPKRKDREAARIVSSDPLAMMKRGAAKVREVEKERKVFNEERERELRRLRKEEKRRGKRRRHGEDDLEGFSLDDPSTENKHRRSDKRDDALSARAKHHHSHGDGGHREDGSKHRHRHGDGHHRSRRDDESRTRHLDGRSRRETARTDNI